MFLLLANRSLRYSFNGDGGLDNGEATCATVRSVWVIGVSASLFLQKSFYWIVFHIFQVLYISGTSTLPLKLNSNNGSL